MPVFLTEMPEATIRRVLLTTDTVGGVWTFSIDLARQFAQHGIQVVLAALGGFPTAEQTSAAKRIPELCLFPSSFKLDWMENPWDDVKRSGEWLLQLEEEFRPDIVHLNSFGHGDLPWSAPVVLTAHSCVLSWWNAVKHEQAPAAWDHYRDAVTRSLQAVHLVTCPTGAMQSMLQEFYGFTGAVVIPNGADPEQFSIGRKEHLVLTAGRLWDEAKNVATVARMAYTLPWPVHAAGEAGHPNGGQADLGGLQLLGRLTPAELAAWFSRAAIFALPARYEPFGLSILEAALSGCALVIGDIPSLREVWGDAALFINPDDGVALHSAISSLISDAKLRAEMAERSYKRALTYRCEKTGQKYLQAYQSVLAAKTMTCVS